MILLEAPPTPINCAIALSGSKSIGNRLLMLKKTLNLNTTLVNLPQAEDFTLLQTALNQISEGGSATLNIKHAGTAMRFLTALLATTPGHWTLGGSEQLNKRPVADLVEALQMAGADIVYLGKEGYPPLQIRGTRQLAHTIAINPQTSSQFVSALLLVAPALANGLEVVLQGTPASAPYIAMTLGVLKQFGIEATANTTRLKIPPSTKVAAPHHFTIEPDWSSASYWYSICALSPGSCITLPHLLVNSLQGDCVVKDIYSQLGVSSTFSADGLQINHTGTTTKVLNWDFSACPDIAQTVAVTCLGLGIPATLRGLHTLPYKETNRIEALKNELEKFGATVETGADFLRLLPAQNPIGTHRAVCVKTYHDHRMALSFAPLSVVHKNLCIDDETVVDKSYPAFWADLKTVGFSVNLQP